VGTVDAPAIPADTERAPVVANTGLREWRRRLIVGLLFVGLVVLMLRPTPRSLTRTVPNFGDPVLMSWVLSWSAHALVTNPLDLFDANIFWPHGYSLAYNEAPLVLAPPFALLRLFGVSQVLAFNLITLGLFGVTLSFTYSLVRWLMGRTDAAIIAAVAYTFSAYAMTHVVHLNLLLLGLFPMAFLLLFRVLDERTTRGAVLLGLAHLAILLGSLYYAAAYFVCAFTILVGYLVVRRVHPGPGLARPLLIAAGLTFVAVPVLWPYYSLGQSRDFVPHPGLRAADIVTAPPGSVLYPSLEGDASAGLDLVDHAFFPGFVTLALGFIGVVVFVALTRRRRRPPQFDSALASGDRLIYGWLLLAAGSVSIVLALGPEASGVKMPLGYLHEHVPGFKNVRVASRFAVPALLALAALAAIGFAAIARRSRRVIAAVAALTVGGFLLLELAATFTHVELPSDGATLAVYEALDKKPDGAVVELPVVVPVAGRPEWAFVEAPRMLYSTRDWKPRFNGYSGSTPRTYFEDLALLNTFPSPAALETMRRLDIRYAVLHTGSFAGVPQYTEKQASAVVSALPPGTHVERRGRAFLVDLGDAES
jgi:hypothetical protein